MNFSVVYNTLTFNRNDSHSELKDKYKINMVSFILSSFLAVGY